MLLTEEQQTAVDLCCDTSHRIVCVTGQAGTGKTTILKTVAEQFVELYSSYNLVMTGHKEADKDSPYYEENLYMQLCAPTGRAAKRIEEATGIPAMTIHRMLRFSMPEDDEDAGLPAYDKFNKMPYKIIFVDEASMLTEDLRRQVIDAMPEGAIIRFFGDINQLPPIGSTSPFAKDLQRFPSVILTQNFRSTDGIISISDSIIKNRMPVSNEQVQVQRVMRGEGLRTLYRLCQEIDFTREDAQIISPTKVSKASGCEIINNYVQQKFNPNKDKIIVYVPDFDGNVSVRSFKRDDKVIWDKNDYNLDLFNGTIGRVLDFNEATGSIFLHIDGRDVEIPSKMEYIDHRTKERKYYDPRTQMLLAYAITTHKAQGSQFDIVAYIISQSRAATRQNVYTAVTRAKNQLYIINVAGALSNAIANKQKLD